MYFFPGPAGPHVALVDFYKVFEAFRFLIGIFLATVMITTPCYTTGIVNYLNEATGKGQ